LKDVGAHCVIIPSEINSIPQFLEICNGFLISGTTPGELGVTRRTEFEKALIRISIEQDKPILGICNGMQRLGGVLGAKVEEIGIDKTDHKPFTYPNRTAHSINLNPSSILAKMTNDNSISVNSFHLQHLQVIDNIEIMATSSDDLVEAISLPSQKCCIGVQWHPEYQLSQFDTAILEYFVAACTSTAAS